MALAGSGHGRGRFQAARLNRRDRKIDGGDHSGKASLAGMAGGTGAQRGVTGPSGPRFLSFSAPPGMRQSTALPARAPKSVS
jgi:hypothetical protein